MWDPNFNHKIDIPILEDRGDHGSDLKKEETKSNQQDSGFLSGPQTYSTSDFEFEESGDLDQLKQSPLSATDTLHSKDNIKYKDSGHVLDSDNPIKNNLTADRFTIQKSPEMFLDSGIEIALSDCMRDLSFSGKLNNLDLKREQKAPFVPKEAEKNDAATILAKQKFDEQLCEFYYRQDDEGDTKLHLAIIGGYTQSIQEIIGFAPHSCLLDIRNDMAQAPIHLAVLTGQPNVVRRLLVAGAKANIRDKDGNTALHLACMSGDLQCVEALTLPITDEEANKYWGNLAKNFSHPCTHLPPDLEQKNYDGEQCVFLAAQRNQVDILRHLVFFGADINAREGKSGYTPLHLAIETGNEKLANFLLKECKQLNVETCTYGRLTAYQMAALLENNNLMCYLRNFGAAQLTPPQSDGDDSDSDYSDYSGNDSDFDYFRK